MWKQVEDFLRKILPFILYAYSGLGILFCIFWLIVGEYGLALNVVQNVTLAWSLVLCLCYMGCKADMTGVEPEMPKKILKWSLSLLGFNIIVEILKLIY